MTTERNPYGLAYALPIAIGAAMAIMSIIVVVAPSWIGLKAELSHPVAYFLLGVGNTMMILGALPNVKYKKSVTDDLRDRINGVQRDIQDMKNIQKDMQRDVQEIINAQKCAEKTAQSHMQSNIRDIRDMLKMLKSCKDTKS